MRKVGKYYEHDVTGPFRELRREKGITLKVFGEMLDKEVERCKNRGMKGPIRIRQIDGGVFGTKVIIRGRQ